MDGLDPRIFPFLFNISSRACRRRCDIEGCVVFNLVLSFLTERTTNYFNISPKHQPPRPPHHLPSHPRPPTKPITSSTVHYHPSRHHRYYHSTNHRLSRTIGSFRNITFAMVSTRTKGGPVVMLDDHEKLVRQQLLTSPAKPGDKSSKKQSKKPADPKPKKQAKKSVQEPSGDQPENEATATTESTRSTRNNSQPVGK